MRLVAAAFRPEEPRNQEGRGVANRGEAMNGKTSDPQARKRQFIHALAMYLSGDLARKSIECERGTQAGREWSDLRSASPIHGWMDVEETERLLTDFFS